MCSCREIIAVNQDKLGKQGKRIVKVRQNASNKIMLVSEEQEMSLIFLIGGSVWLFKQAV